MALSLSSPQNVFLNGLDTKFRAYVGGFGSGKTFIGCLDLAIFAARHPKTMQGYFAPTYRDIRDIFFPTFEEAASLMGFTVRTNIGDKECHLYRNGAYYGTIICRSMENPETIVGFKIARALVDEIDTLRADKADRAWNKIIARMRLTLPGVENSVGVTTTPEGFGFVYERFANEPKASYSMVQASTYENQDYLPVDYIDSLIESYPSQLVQAYLMGQFVNLTSGTVYRSYNRVAHRSIESHQPGEPILIGMDFNIDHMAATGYVLRDNAMHAVYQIKDGYNTNHVAQAIRDRFPTETVVLFPDSSGKNRTTAGKGASESDISILRNEFGFECRYKPTNPRVRDRVNATNAAFEQGRLYVNDTLCPDVAACFEQQIYDQNGEPDKKSGKDHQNDASTYPIAYEMPIIKPVPRFDIGMVR